MSLLPLPLRWLLVVIAASVPCWPRQALAQPGSLLRFAVLAKSTLDTHALPTAGLEAALAKALGPHGVRLVDLDVASQAQRLAWANGEGRIPSGINPGLVDALYTLSLDCTQTASAVLGSVVHAVQCTLSSKVLRASSGEVVYSASESALPGHGLSGESAVNVLIAGRLPARLARMAQDALAPFTQPQRWKVDLNVTDLSDRQVAQDAVQLLTQLPGVSAARLDFYRKQDGLAQYQLAGDGVLDLVQLGSAIEAQPALALSLEYEAPGVLRASFDLARKRPRPVMLLGVVQQPDSAQVRELPILRSGLSIVPYLLPAHASPVLTSERKLAGDRAALRKRAQALGVASVLCLTLLPRDAVWFATASLHDVASDRELVSAASTGAVPEAAFSSALQAFDRKYRATLASAPTSAAGLSAVPASAGESVVIDAFRLQQRGEQQVAQVVVRNLGAREAQLRARVLADRKLVASLDLGTLPAGKDARHELLLAALPSSRDGALDVKVDYNIGGELHSTSSRLIARTNADTDLSLGPELPPEYYVVLQPGYRAYNLGLWLDAEQVFLQAWERWPNARLALAIGRVQMDLRQYAPAEQYLNLALELNVRPLPEEQRRLALDLLQQLAQRPGTNVP